MTNEKATMTKTENPMGTKPVLPLLLRMAVPPMISMFTTSMYNIVDSMYVSAMGQKALTAVSLVFPLQNTILSVAVGVGVGMNSLIARAIGARKQEEADTVAGQAMLAVLLHYIGFILIGLFLARPYLSMFTKDPQVLSMGVSYAKIVLGLSFGTLIYLIYEKIFQAEGIMYVPMMCQLVGAAINIVLDPILIFGKFGFPEMGVAGAAVATVIGQVVSLILIILLYMQGKSEVKIRRECMRFNGRVMKNIYTIAIPSALVMCMPSILVSVLNGILTGVSEAAVAAFGLYYKLQTFVYQPSSGLVQALRPVVAYNYGAKNYKRMNDTVKTGMLVVAVIMAVGTALALAAPETILSFFHAEGDLMEIGTSCLTIISAGFIVSSVGVIFAGTFEALGKGHYSLTISLLRQMTVIPLLAPLMLRLAGLPGIWLTFPLAEAVAALVGFGLYRNILKRLKQ